MNNLYDIYKVDEFINIINEDLLKETYDRFFIDYTLNKLIKTNEIYTIIENKQIIDIINNNIDNYKLVDMRDVSYKRNGIYKGRGFYPDGTYNISLSLIFDKL